MKELSDVEGTEGGSRPFRVAAHRHERGSCHAIGGPMVTLKHTIYTTTSSPSLRDKVVAETRDCRLRIHLFFKKIERHRRCGVATQKYSRVCGRNQKENPKKGSKVAELLPYFDPASINEIYIRQAS